jgi:hypothetical protein
MTYKTTRKDEDYFEARVRHWLKVLNLGDWKVDVYRKKLEDMTAACELWHNAHGAHIMINTELAYQPEKKWLDRLALHEVGHVLLCDLKRLINDRCVTDAMAETAEHAVIRRLESALW